VVWQGGLVVGSGQEVLIERMGRFHRLLTPGFHVIVPFIDTPKVVNWSRLSEVNNRVQPEIFHSFLIPTNEMLYDFPLVEVITNDRLQVNINGLIFFRINDSHKAAYQINNLWKSVEELVKTSLVNTASTMDLDKIFVSRSLLQTSLQHDFKEPSLRWGITITLLEIQSIRPSTAIVELNEKIVRDKREADSLLARINTEGEAQLTKSKLEQQAKVIQIETLKREQTVAADSKYYSMIKESESRGMSVKIEAEAERQKRMLEIESEIAFVRGMKEAGVSEEYLIKLKYVDAWNSLATAGNQSQLIVPYEAATFLGAINATKFAFGPGALSNNTSVQPFQ